MIDEKISSKIRILPPITINRIAAGEVVERPSSVVKELVENSLDANATEITIKIESSGRNLILISDNGCGMSKDDLLLSIERHATSKLESDNLLDIHYFGFRGEALPSIASISRMSITSSLEKEEEGWSLRIVGGEIQNLSPTPPIRGTTVEIKDLFFATPARLKFLRSEKIETQHIIDIVKRIALANPKVKIMLFSEQKQLSDYRVADSPDHLLARIKQCFNKDFVENSIEVSKNHEDYKIKGYISLPTYDRATTSDYYTFVNGRPVKDKLIISAIKNAYQDFLSRDRYPMIALFLEIPSDLVDVNVHPSKTEVRFRDPQQIRGLVVTSIREALERGACRTSSTITEDTLASMRTEPLARNYSDSNPHIPSYQRSFSHNQYSSPRLNTQIFSFNQPIAKEFQETPYIPEQLPESYKLGAARCQLHETYLISQTKDSIVIVDQHAAHERLTYEKLKQEFNAKGIEKQRLLVPEIIELPEGTMEKILSIKQELSDLGLTVNQCTNKSMIVTEIPHLLGNCNVKKLTLDLIDEITDSEESSTLKELINHTLATYACHYSIRSGRQMNIDEMNQLIRQMETTPHSGQCNHGRPTYIELKLKDIEKLFGRT